MAIFAYTYTDPLLDDFVDAAIWGVEVDEVYADIAQRCELKRFLGTLSSTCSGYYLLLRKLDELGDSLTEIGDRLQRIEQAGVTIITTEQDYHSTHRDNPQQLSQLLQGIGDRQKSRKIQQGHAKNRRNCLPPPGRAPYGYKRGQDRYLIDRSTAPIVQAFCEHFLLYGSLRGSVRYIERRFGKKIAVSTGRKWLTNPAYRGNLHYKDGTTIPQTHAAILSDNEAAQIDRLLRRNRRLSPRSASAPRCLAGLVQCQTCQKTLTISRVTQRRKAQEYLYLRSPNCPQDDKCPAIAYEDVFRRTVQNICQEFPKLADQQNAPPLAAIQSQIQQRIQQKTALIATLPNLIEQDILDIETAALRRYTLQNDIAQLQNQRNQLPPANLRAIAQTLTLEQFWYDLSEAERRFYLREFIAQIYIAPHPNSPWEIQLKFIF
ncbi:recombinase family protein [[Limnothrix rosea] IAM M-220]|uniref:recombinase family protein n=1 Tax=[Limnothrix rosea] IAM M-220 TaxID=454133 RepID=UPI00096971EE|nr:recombinase family protein [[Limnothrix rosea] IAM M-220]OKH15974.1 recombinase family protein [[Limnothrix rosea] IAM M-220]